MVVEEMRSLTERPDGWINIEPTIRDDVDLTPRSPLAAFLANRGPVLPFATWIPGPVATLGIEHSTGPKVAARLADNGVVIPNAWPIKQDHPRRGLVVELPDELTPEAVLELVLDAGTALVELPIDTIWSAVIHRRR